MKITDIKIRIRYINKEFILFTEGKFEGTYYNSFNTVISTNNANEILLELKENTHNETKLNFILDCIQKHRQNINVFMSDVEEAEDVVKDSAWHVV